MIGQCWDILSTFHVISKDNHSGSFQPEMKHIVEKLRVCKLQESKAMAVEAGWAG